MSIQIIAKRNVLISFIRYSYKEETELFAFKKYLRDSIKELLCQQQSIDTDNEND